MFHNGSVSPPPLADYHNPNLMYSVYDWDIKPQGIHNVRFSLRISDILLLHQE